MTLPLEPYTVIDLTRARSGPTCVRQLADMGASVIQISAREDVEGDFPRRGFDSQNLHRNKRSLTLDLKSPRGIEIIHKLVKNADVVVENFRPDVKTRLGIDYETLSRINPRLVYGSISGFGQDGPYRDRPGYDQIAQGMGGLMSITGLPGQGPVRVGIPVADLTAGHLPGPGHPGRAARARAVREGPVGAHLAAAGDGDHARLPGRALAHRPARSRPRPATTIPTAIPTGVFKTADGHLNIAASGQHMFRRLCEAPRHRAAARGSALPHRAGPLEEPQGARGGAGEGIRQAHHPGVGRGAQRQGRAVGPDPRRQAGLRGRADPPPRRWRCR